jgi:hypothetical protein
VQSPRNPRKYTQSRQGQRLVEGLTAEMNGEKKKKGMETTKYAKYTKKTSTGANRSRPRGPDGVNSRPFAVNFFGLGHCVRWLALVLFGLRSLRYLMLSAVNLPLAPRSDVLRSVVLLTMAPFASSLPSREPFADSRLLASIRGWPKSSVVISRAFRPPFSPLPHVVCG